LGARIPSRGVGDWDWLPGFDGKEIDVTKERARILRNLLVASQYGEAVHHCLTDQPHDLPSNASSRSCGIGLKNDFVIFDLFLGETDRPLGCLYRRFSLAGIGNPRGARTPKVR
jgi:hypothetical protein